MAEDQIRFDDGAAYERMMGNWSQRAGGTFLDWLEASPGLKWIDVGCGNGAFTELLIERCAPVEVEGIDPSEGQLAFARIRPAARIAKFSRGDAMALPFPANTFDAATMALVIYFTPEPMKGVIEMARVVRSGGMVAAYAWDMFGGGFPLEPIRIEMRARAASGQTVVLPSRLMNSRRLMASPAPRTPSGMKTIAHFLDRELRRSLHPSCPLPCPLWVTSRHREAFRPCPL